MSNQRRMFPVEAESFSVHRAPFSGIFGDVVLIPKVLRRLENIVRARGRGDNGGRGVPFRPTGEGLESKTLLSGSISWTGGDGGTSSSLITPANISKLTEQYADFVDSAIVAEPLVAPVDITVGAEPGPQTVVFVATENNSLYAFNEVTGQLAWHTSVLNPGNGQLAPYGTDFHGSGITGTPVIDAATNTIYLVSSQSYVAGTVIHYTKTLHAVNMSDGTELPGSPAVIADTGYSGGKVVSFAGPSVRGKGDGSIRGRVNFYVPQQLQRPALTIDGNDVIIAFGTSYADQPPMHGWILAYDKTSLLPTGVFNVTPNGQEGGVWNSGGPIQVDSQGYLYTATGNGTFDATLNAKGFPARGDYGDSVLKLALDPGYKGPNGTGIRVVDYFTPHNQAKLYKSDGDLASSGVLIIPDGLGGSAHPNLLLASGKSGTLYLIDRQKMGHFHQGLDHIVQEPTGAVTSSH